MKNMALKQFKLVLKNLIQIKVMIYNVLIIIKY